MCVRSCTINVVLRVDCEFQNYDFPITKGKHSGDKKSMLEFLQSIRFDKINRNIFFNHSSSAPSASTVSLLTTTANSISKTNTQPYLTLVKLTLMAKTSCYGGSTIQNFATVDWLYNYRPISLFRQMHPEKGGGLYVQGSEQGVSGTRGNRVYISTSWNFWP